MAKRELEKPGEMTGQSWLDMIGGGGNTGIQVVGTDPSLFGSESAGPMGLIATGEAVECGGGAIPVYVEGQGFRGCYSPDESWIKPFLDKTGKFATFPADDPAISNLIDPEEGKKLQELIEQYGEDVVNTAKGIYDDLKDFIEGAQNDPIGTIVSIVDVVAETGIPEKCQDLKDCKTADPDKGTYCWKDCVNFSILVGIPGLPSLPGMGDLGTYRDFEEAVKKVGTTIGDIFEGNNKCGEDTDEDGEPDQECTVGQVIKDLGSWSMKKLEEVLKGIEDATLDDAYDWIKGILGVVIGGYVFTQIEDQIKDVFFPITPIDEDCPEDPNEINETNFEKCGYKDCGEGKYVKEGESCEEVEPFDETQCTEQGYFEQNKDACEAAGYVNCSGGENTEGQETTGGIIKGTLDDCDVIQDPQCSDVGTYNPDTRKCDCPEGYEFEVETGGTCGDKIDTTVDCSLEENKDLPECKEEPLIECPQNTPNAGQMVVNEADCGAAITCPDPNRQTKADGSCGECESGFKLNEEGLCEKEEVIVDPEEPYEPDCSQPRPTGLVTFDLIDQQRAWDRKCGGVTGPSPCDQQDRVTNEDGSCGPCKPGFVDDPQGFDQCVKAPDECNDCSCAEYAAANPQECGETPTTTETGGGASVGGGAGGAFSPFLAGISYTPQPVPEIMQTPQAGMLTQAAPQQPSRNTDILGGSIVAGLLGKYMVQDILDDIFKLSK